MDFTRIAEGHLSDVMRVSQEISKSDVKILFIDTDAIVTLMVFSFFAYFGNFKTVG